MATELTERREFMEKLGTEMFTNPEIIELGDGRVVVKERLTQEQAIAECRKHIEWLQTQSSNFFHTMQAINTILGRYEIMDIALTDIGCYHDLDASDNLRNTGSYSSFDEPGSVKIAREVLDKGE